MMFSSAPFLLAASCFIKIFTFMILNLCCFISFHFIFDIVICLFYFILFLVGMNASDNPLSALLTWAGLDSLVCIHLNFVMSPSSAKGLFSVKVKIHFIFAIYVCSLLSDVPC